MRKLQRGFTLQEIMVVIVIIGVMAALAVPQYASTIEKFKAAEGERMLFAILDAQKQFFLDNGNFATNANDVDITLPSSDNFDLWIVTDPAVLGYVGIVRRAGTDPYFLAIDEDGGISCSVISGPATKCSKLGY